MNSLLLPPNSLLVDLCTYCNNRLAGLRSPITRPFLEANALSGMDSLAFFQHADKLMNTPCTGGLFLRCLNPKENSVAVRAIKRRKEDSCLWVMIKLNLQIGRHLRQSRRVVSGSPASVALCRLDHFFARLVASCRSLSTFPPFHGFFLPRCSLAPVGVNFSSQNSPSKGFFCPSIQP